MRRAAAAFALFFVVRLALVAPALPWPMVFDDLHLVRTYSAGELVSAWRGSWDPDGIETPAWRPLSPAFNHARAALFGENVVAQRVFLAALFAGVLALLVPLAGRLGLPYGSALLAGLLMLATRYSAYHDVWITDGNHLVQGLAVLASAVWLSDGLEDGRRGRLFAALGGVAVSLLVREDTLAALPGLVLVGAWVARSPTARRRLAVWTASAAVLAIALLVVRRLAVPEAPALRFDLPGFARAVARVLNPVGWESFDTPSAGVGRGFAAILAVTLAGLAWRRTTRLARLALRWLAAAIAACAPALVLQRDDLFFFPSLFVALFLATAWTALAERGGAARTAVALAAAWALLGGAWTERVFAENFHPASARAVDWNTQMLYGPYAGARIPPARREAVAARLSLLGIRPGEAPRQRVRDLIAEAKAAGRRRPTPDGRVFFPRLPEMYF